MPWPPVRSAGSDGKAAEAFEEAADKAGPGERDRAHEFSKAGTGTVLILAVNVLPVQIWLLTVSSPPM